MTAPSVYRETTVKRTAKTHRCCECRHEIPKGSPCKITFGVWDGNAESFRWCIRCDVLKTTLLGSVDPEEVNFTELHEWIRELCR